MGTENVEQVLSQIADLAPNVAQSAEVLAHAIDVERTAEAAVLERAIAAVRPALRALSSRIVSESYETSGRNGCNPVSRTEYHGARGVVLVDEYTRDRDSSGNRGEITGYRIYLLADGSLARVERAGSFSHWQGEADTWESTISPTTARAVMDVESLDECLAALVSALQEHAKGNAEARAQKAAERAERLQALAALAK